MLAILPALPVVAFALAALVANHASRAGGPSRGGGRGLHALLLLAALGGLATPIAMQRLDRAWLSLPWLGWLDAILGPFEVASWGDRAQGAAGWSAAFARGPALAVDIPAAVLLATLGLSALAALWSARRATLDALVWPLLVVAASALVIVSSGSPLGLVCAWLALDASLFFAGMIQRRGLLVSQFGLWLLLVALAALPIDQEQTFPGDGQVWIEAWAGLRTWLILAGAVRMGLYPVPWSVPRTPADALWQGPLTRLGPTLAGLCILLRGAAQGPSPEAAPSLVLVLAGLLSLLFASLLAGTVQDRGARLDWLTMAGGALAVLAAALPDRLSVLLVLAIGVEIGLGRGLMYISPSGWVTPNATRRSLWWLGAASLVGLPLTLGFGLRVAFLDRWFGSAPAVLSILLLIALSLLARGLWLSDGAGGTRPAGHDDDGAATAVPPAAAVVALPLLALGILALPIPAGPWLQAQLVLGDPSLDRRLLLGLLLPPALGYLLRPQSTNWPAARPSTLRRPARWLRIGETFDAWRTGVIAAGRVLHATFSLLDSRRAMAWTLFAGLVIGMSILASGPAAPSVRAEGFRLGLVYWVAAAALGIAALGLRRSGPVLVSILLAHALSAWVLLATAGPLARDTMIVVALVKAVAGLITVAILTLSVLDTQGGGLSLASASAVLRRPRGRPLDPELGAERRLLMAGALIGVLVVGGIQSSALAAQLSSAVLRPALVLILVGFLGTIHAESALRLAQAAFFALIGFEMIYSRLDPGLLVTGGLAAFQILLALLVTAFMNPDTWEAAPS